MRMQAKVELQYAGNTYEPGDLFDATDADGLVLKNRELANPFNLEDPAFRTTASPGD